MRSDIHRVLEHAAAHPDILGPAETQLLTEWLGRLSSAAPENPEGQTQW